jgi:hypothetical protein
MKKTLFILFVACINFHLNAFDKVVIWGHKLHSHTHSYIHYAFYKAFQHLGYETYHLDNEDDICHIDFSNALFLTEGQVDQKIPLREDGFYILHNCDMGKYHDLCAANRCMILQVYTDDVLSRNTAHEVAPLIYEDLVNRILYMPWATDLLPHEIECQKPLLGRSDKKRYIAWGGTISDGVFGNRSELEPFIQEAKKNKILLAHKTNIDPLVMRTFIRQAYMAPAIVGEWQKKQGYIPCRIFKNISYGQLGITNSYRVYELFNKKIVYDSDTVQLFYKAKQALTSFNSTERQELMDFVKDHHTYINRIYSMLNFIEKLQN